MSGTDNTKESFGMVLYGLAPTLIMGIALLFSTQSAADHSQPGQQAGNRQQVTVTAVDSTFLSTSDLPDLW